MCINADYRTECVKLIIGKDLKVLQNKGNTKVTVLKDISFVPVC